MKKKCITIIFALTFTFTFVACGNNKDENTATTQPKHKVEAPSTIEDEETEEESDGELSPEEEATLEKERQESLTVYADMITEIQADIPELNVQYVVGKEDGGKSLSIHMDLLESKDATYTCMSTLVTTKETLLNNNGITDINFFVYSGEESAGIVMFENESGRYNPVVNTL